MVAYGCVFGTLYSRSFCFSAWASRRSRSISSSLAMLAVLAL